MCAAEEMATGGYNSSSTSSGDISDSSCSETSIYISYSSSEEECMEEGGDADDSGASAGSKTFNSKRGDKELKEYC